MSFVSGRADGIFVHPRRIYELRRPNVLTMRPRLRAWGVRIDRGDSTIVVTRWGEIRGSPGPTSAKPHRVARVRVLLGCAASIVRFWLKTSPFHSPCAAAWGAPESPLPPCFRAAVLREPRHRMAERGVLSAPGAGDNRVSFRAVFAVSAVQARVREGKINWVDQLTADAALLAAWVVITAADASARL